MCFNLQLDPRKRLGAEEKDWEDIKSHHFFTGVNWEQIEAAAGVFFCFLGLNMMLVCCVGVLCVCRL